MLVLDANSRDLHAFGVEICMPSKNSWMIARSDPSTVDLFEATSCLSRSDVWQAEEDNEQRALAEDHEH